MSKTGYILRNHLEEQLRYAIEDASKRVIPAGENQGYELGKQLGYTDGLKAAQKLLKDLQDTPKPEERFVYGRSFKGRIG